MKVLIYKTKHQREEMTIEQYHFASHCAGDYLFNNYDRNKCYNSARIDNQKFGCDVHRNKTTISAVVYYK